MATDLPLVGETLTAVTGMEAGSCEVEFRTASGKRFRMYHDQDCCESVGLEDVTGDPANLIGHPLLVAREDCNWDPASKPYEHAYSWTWTFYNFATVKGWVTLRWLGESDGYCSEDVRVVEVPA